MFGVQGCSSDFVHSVLYVCISPLQKPFAGVGEEDGGDNVLCSLHEVSNSVTEALWPGLRLTFVYLAMC